MSDCSYSFSSALVTGSNGFIGSALVEHLAKNNIETYCIVRKKAKIDLPSCVKQLIVSELTPENIFEATKNIRTEVIFHLAAYGVLPEANDPLITANVNITSAVALLKIAKTWDLKNFIHIGSCFEYGDTVERKLIREDLLLYPQTIYAASKVAAKIYLTSVAKQLNIPFVHLRLFGVYGAGEAKTRLIPYVIDMLSNNQEVRLSPGLQIRDLLYIDDVISALTKAVDLKDKYETYNICSSEAIAVKSIVKKIAKLIDKSEKYLNFGAIPIREQEVMWLVGDNKKFKQATQWQPEYNLEQGLLQTIKLIRAKKKCIKKQFPYVFRYTMSPKI